MRTHYVTRTRKRERERIYGEKESLKVFTIQICGEFLLFTLYRLKESERDFNRDEYKGFGRKEHERE